VKNKLLLGALLLGLSWPTAAQVPDAPHPPSVVAAPADPAPPPPAAGIEKGPAPQGADASPTSAGGHRRGAWYIGFGLGDGNGQVTVGGRSLGFSSLLGRRVTTVAFNIRAGVTLTPQWLVGFDGGAVGASASGPAELVQLNVYDVGVMFFPWREGFYLRGAAGTSNVSIKSDGPVLGGTGTLWGTNALAGAGYAWWLGTSFNLTFSADYRQLWHAHRGPDGVTTAGGWSAWLGFDWY
jgi:hypothetical protein